MTTAARKLPYDLKWQASLEGQGDIETVVIPIPPFDESNDKIVVAFLLSRDEFVMIAEAIDVGADIAFGDQQHLVWDLWAGRMVDICQIIQDCIGAQLEALQSSIDTLTATVNNVSNTVNNIETSTENSAAKPPSGITFNDASFRCGGALALVDYMHAQNMAVYAEAEASAVDNISEMIIAVLKSIPALETLPVGVLGSLTQSYFENQVTTYEADFALARIEMASLLACMIEDNANALTYDVWGDWLEEVEAIVPSNAAASLFARYSPARQTLINQIAALLNADQSLEAYFKQLFAAYNAGEDNPSNACETCVEYLEYDYTSSNQGFTIVSNRGTYAPPFQTTRFLTGSIYSVAVHFERQIGVARTVNRIEMDVTMTSGTQQTTPYSRFQVLQSNNTTVVYNTTIQSGQLAAGNHTIVYNATSFNVPASGYIRFDRWLYDNANSVPSGYAVASINKVRLYFTDAVPTDWGGTPV